MNNALNIPGVWFCTLLLSACSAESNFTNDDTAYQPNTSGDTSDFGVDTDRQQPAEFLSLDGTLVVEDGVLSGADSQLAVSLFNASGQLCSEDMQLNTSEPSTVPAPELVASAWWTLTLVVPTVTGCDVPSPMTFGLGAIAYDPQLQPAADASGMSENASSLFTAAIQLTTDGPIYAFGLLGTQAQFSGDETADALTPLPDGTYSLATLYLLPLAAIDEQRQ